MNTAYSWGEMRCLIVIIGLWMFTANAGQAQSAHGDPKISQAIDGIILKELAANKLTPSPRADNAELVRRIYLDLLGRISSTEEFAAWSQDASPEKDHRLIDKLLDHPEMALFWVDLLEVWLNGRDPQPGPGAKEFRDYLRKGLEANKSWERIARELLLPGVDDETQPAAYFLAKRLRLPNEDQLDGMTVAVGASFFGIRVECAKCHDHPYVSEWTQDHYYGLASFLNRTQLVNSKNKPVLGEKADGEVAFVTTKRAAKKAHLMFLDNKVFAEPPLSKRVEENYITPPGKDTPATPKFSARKTLADYALSKDNAYFRRAMVNRIWKQLLGRGLVEPVDQIHEANEASHPELLQRLAEDFADYGFDLKRLIAVIMHSDAYRRSSRWQGEGDRPEDSLYATAILRPLRPEQLLHSIALATGHTEMLKNKQKGNLDAGRLRNELEKDLKAFVDLYHSDADGFAATTAQALFMTYNSLPQKYLQNAKDNLLFRLRGTSDNRSAIRDAYIAVLSRDPAATELQSATQYLQSTSTPREQRLRDLVWALLASPEFRFNH